MLTYLLWLLNKILYFYLKIKNCSLKINFEVRKIKFTYVINNLNLYIYIYIYLLIIIIFKFAK